MTDSEMIKAVLFKIQRFGLADEDVVTSMLPAAIAKFLGTNTWEFLWKNASLNSVANQEYLTPPTDFWKLVTIRRTDYPVEYITPQEYDKRIAVGGSGGVEGTSYTIKGKRIYLEPTPSGVVAYTITYCPLATNVSLEQIPGSYHFAVQAILESEATPMEHAAYPVAVRNAELAVDNAIAIDNQQPQRTVRSRLDPIQEVLNVGKYRKQRGRGTPFQFGER